MREIRLNSTQYKLAAGSEVDQRSINPFIGRLGGAGSPAYSDFSQASAEEYFDFRNGIGKKRGLASESRLDWSEGIDFTTEGQAVLGSLVNTADYAVWEATTAYTAGAGTNPFSFVHPTTADGKCYECTTAGTSGGTEPTWDDTIGNTTNDGTVVWTCRAYLAPIKIIDFKGADSTKQTYVIKNSRIEKWDSANSVLVVKDNAFASPIDAIVVTDSTDEYLIVSSATGAVYTVDGTTWIDMATITWKTPDSTTDPNSEWTDDALAIDDDTATYAEDSTIGTLGPLDFNLTTALFTDRARMWIAYAGGTTTVIVSFYYDGAWNQVYSQASPAAGSWVTITNSAGFKFVSKVRILFSGTSTYARIHEVDVGAPVCGYLAGYSNRLYWVAIDGKTVGYSISKDIDAPSGAFELTDNYGTIYDLFEGKLLADGSPTLYLVGTEGTFTIDVTNEIAYKQEVAYPNLTYAGHKGLYWNANVWVATGYGILKVAPSVATYIGPDLDDGLPSGYIGYIYDMVTVNNWLVYCVNGGATDKSSIIKRNSSYGGNLQVYTTSAVNKPIACLHHSPSSLYTNGRLWFGEGTDVKYMMFPDTTSNVKQIATYQYVDDSGYGTFPIFRKMAGIPKTALRVAAITKSCSATDYIEVFYGLNGAAATTSLGTFTSSPKPTTLTFNSGLGTTFYTIQFAIKLYRGGTPTNSPELESLIFYYYPTPTMISRFIFNIDATGDEGDRIFTEFEAIRGTNTLVAFYPSGDSSKTSYNVKLTQMPSRSWWEEMGGRAGYFTVVLEEISKD